MNPLFELSDQELLSRLREGRDDAAYVLFERYTARLTALARGRISKRLARRVDAEDVVHSAWRSFLIAGRDGRWGTSSEDLWPLLAALTLRKLWRQAARHHAGRRDINREQPHDHRPADVADLAAASTSEDLVLQLADELDEVLEPREAIDREIVFLRLSGQDAPSVAKQLNCSERTVRRVIEDLRRSMSERIGDDRDLRFGSVDMAALLRAMSGGTWTQREIQNSPVGSAHWADYPEIPFSDLLLTKMIGQGGVGRVYRGALRSAGRTVAVKFLKKRFWSSALAVHSLFVELSTVAVLDHPGILKHYGWGRTPSGVPFLVMEWFEGWPISEWVRKTRPAKLEIMKRVADAAEALAAAHAAGVIHGDITPSNILTSEDGRTVVMDFGFASRVEADQPTMIAGTAGFLAPEQLAPAAGSIGPWTDVYGIGKTLLALLTGDPSCTETGIAAFDEIIQRCVVLDPALRLRSMANLANELHLACNMPSLTCMRLPDVLARGD